LLLAVILAVVCGGRATVHAAPAGDKREVQARKDFAAGRYQQAVDLFAELFAELGDPVYLRNIGRCYQEMGKPADAIRSFRYYLQKMTDITPGERKEVEGFIAQLEKDQADHGTTTAPPTAPPAPTPTPAPVVAKPAAAPAPEPAPVTPITTPPPTAPPPAALPPSEPPPPSLVVTDAHPSETAPATSPFYGRWWFWTAVGVVVAGGVVAVLVARANRGEIGDCHGISPCQQIGGN
jgi:hypothetical protein